MPTEDQLETAIDESVEATGNAGADTSLETQETTETRAADDTGERAVPYHRFQEVNNAVKDYRKYGKPEEVADKLRRLEALEARDAQIAEEARQAAAAEARKANPQQADAKEFVRGAILEEFPELKHLRAETDRARVAYVERGFEDLPARLEKQGLAVTPESLKSLRYMVESQILSDKEGLGDSFWDPSRQRDAVDEAFDRVKKTVLDPALRANGAKTLDAARERRTRTLDRAAQTGTARATPATFTSKHPMGSVGYEMDRRAYNDKQFDIALDAEHDGDEVSL